MSDHLHNSYIAWQILGAMHEPIQLLREKVLEEGDLENNNGFEADYLCFICRRMRRMQAAAEYKPDMEEEGVIVWQKRTPMQSLSSVISSLSAQALKGQSSEPIF